VEGFKDLAEARLFEFHWQRPERFGLLPFMWRNHPSVTKPLHHRNVQDHTRILKMLLEPSTRPLVAHYGSNVATINDALDDSVDVHPAVIATMQSILEP
jgi:hypothetical protein